MQSLLKLSRGGLLALTLCSLVSAAGAGVRKNIEDLTPNELAAYEHAVDVMKKKSLANKNDRQGFLWQAWVHDCNTVYVPDSGEPVPSSLESDGKFAASDRNCPTLWSLPPANHHAEHPGMCEHGKDRFLSWHRAEFYFYEQALQAADPEGLTGPSTKNVTVPYWDFTTHKGNERFPAAFTNRNSPLYYPGRTEGPLTPADREVTSRDLLAYMIYELNWPQFGGYVPGGPGNYGAFESKIHNYMHSVYVGGDLANTTTAGLDPIFFSYHAFIDNILDKWISEHGADTVSSQNDFLRGQQSMTNPPPGFESGDGIPNMGQVKLYLSSEKLGYSYDPGRQPAFLTRQQFLDSKDRYFTAYGRKFGVAKVSYFAYLLSSPPNGPKATQPGKPGNFNRLFGPVSHPGAIIPSVGVEMPAALQATDMPAIEIVRKSTAHDYSFQADVYLHPKSVKANIADRAFRNRYLASSGSYWALSGAGHEHGHGNSDTALTLSVQQPVNSIVESRRNRRDWMVTVALTPSDANAIRADEFAPPALVIIPAQH